MPTFETTRRFEKDYARLDPAQKELFRKAIKAFVHDLTDRKGVFRGSLRVRRIKSAQQVYEMTWDKESDVGRATFMFGPSRRPGDPHVIWRRCGSHRIFDAP